MIKKHFLNQKQNSNTGYNPSCFLLGSKPVIAFVVFFIFLHLFSITAHAEDVTNSLDFPFTLIHSANLNNYFSDNSYAIENDVNTAPLFSDSDYVFIPIDLDYYGSWDDWDWYWITIVAVPIDTFNNPPSEHLVSSPITANLVSGKDAYIFKLWIDVNGNYLSHVEDFYPVDVSEREFFGSHNTTTFSNYTFTSGYPVSWYKDYYSLNNTLILEYSGGGSVVGSLVAPFGADATNSDFLGANADFGASVSQATMPNSPTYNTYNFTTYNPPTFDDSSILDSLSSIYDILVYTAEYLATNIGNAIETLGDNIQIAIEYIGDLIEYVARSIITNIQYALQNIFDNLQSLFEPLLNFISSTVDSINQKLDYISQPFDTSVIQDTFENTGLHSDIDSISQFTSTAFGVFDSVSEPNDFKIPLHLENIALLNISQVQYIDLGCINSVKSLIRAVMWCLTTFSLLYTIIYAIPSYISGGD